MTIHLSLNNRAIPIIIGKNILGHLGRLIKKTSLGTDAIIITMPGIKNRFGKNLEDLLKKTCRSVAILTIPDSEESKNAFLALRLIDKITRMDKNKKIFLLALGGGVVGDLTGFIAAIYKRGVPYVQIPTTLLAQVDSSIGGKTAVDTAWGKNLIGAFYQPRLIVCDTVFLETLPREQLLSGLAEAVKYGIIKDTALFNYFEKNASKILSRDEKNLRHILARCAAIKARIVNKDERDEKGIRIALNFGHTFGHAIEAASLFGISHGKAVSIGMACACDLSVRLGLLHPQTSQRIIGLLRRLGLPTIIKNLSSASILKAMAFDKKFAARNRFVLLAGIGRVKIIEGISQENLREILIGRITKTAS